MSDKRTRKAPNDRYECAQFPCVEFQITDNVYEYVAFVVTNGQMRSQLELVQCNVKTKIELIGTHCRHCRSPRNAQRLPPPVDVSDVSLGS